MKKGLILTLVSLLILVAVPVSAGGPSTLVVDDDSVECPKAKFTTIQAAVDAASPGDKIRVCAGTYAGATIDKALELRQIVAQCYAEVVEGTEDPTGRNVFEPCSTMLKGLKDAALVGEIAYA